MNTGKSLEPSGRPQEWSWGTEAQELGFREVISCLSLLVHVHGAPGQRGLGKQSEALATRLGM